MGTVIGAAMGVVKGVVKGAAKGAAMGVKGTGKGAGKGAAMGAAIGVISLVTGAALARVRTFVRSSVPLRKYSTGRVTSWQNFFLRGSCRAASRAAGEGTTEVRAVMWVILVMGATRASGAGRCLGG